MSARDEAPFDVEAAFSALDRAMTDAGMKPHVSMKPTHVKMLQNVWDIGADPTRPEMFQDAKSGGWRVAFPVRETKPRRKVFALALEQDGADDADKP